MKLWLIGLAPYLVIRGMHYWEAGRFSQAKDSFVIAGGAVLAFIISLVPSLIARNTHITLPWEVDFIITLALYLHVALGGAAGFYYTKWAIPYDKLLHLFGTAMIAFLAFLIIFTLYYTRKIRLSFIWMGIFIFMAAVTLGSIWEIMEFTLDQLVDTKAQSGLYDTMMDMVMDFFGGILAAVLGTTYARFSKPKSRRRIAIPLAQLFGYLPRSASTTDQNGSLHQVIEAGESSDDTDMIKND